MMSEAGVLSPLDLAALAVLGLLLLVLVQIKIFTNSRQAPRPQKPAGAEEVTLVGGITMAPDISPTMIPGADSNDPLLLTYNSQGGYVGPEQGALALNILAESEHYTRVAGYAASDTLALLLTSEPPPAVSVTDSAALPHAVLLDANVDLEEEAMPEAAASDLQWLRIVIIVFLLLPILYRLFAS